MKFIMGTGATFVVVGGVIAAFGGFGPPVIFGFLMMLFGFCMVSAAMVRQLDSRKG